MKATGTTKKTESYGEGNIYVRVAKIANEIGAIEKNMVVGSGVSAYEALADVDVILKVKEAEQKYGVVSVPVKMEIVESKEIKTLNSNNSEDVYFVDVVKMIWEFVNLDRPSDKIVVESAGRGIDYGDKGLNKAITYARKNALRNAYKIGASAKEDPEATKSEKKTVKKTEDMRIAITNYFADKPEELPKVLKSFAAENLAEITDKDIKTIYNTYHKKGLL